MNRTGLTITGLVLGAVIAAGCGGSRARQATLTGETADLSGAGTAEVRNAQGQVILSGRFAVTDSGDGMERTAVLAATQVDADALGEAEVEVSGSGDDRKQEIEFSVRNVEPGATLTFVIDARALATAVADDRGRIEFEQEVPLPRGR